MTDHLALPRGSGSGARDEFHAVHREALGGGPEGEGVGQRGVAQVAAGVRADEQFAGEQHDATQVRGGEAAGGEFEQAGLAGGVGAPVTQPQARAQGETVVVDEQGGGRGAPVDGETVGSGQQVAFFVAGEGERVGAGVSGGREQGQRVGGAAVGAGVSAGEHDAGGGGDDGEGLAVAVQDERGRSQRRHVCGTNGSDRLAPCYRWGGRRGRGGGRVIGVRGGGHGGVREAAQRSGGEGLADVA